MGLPCTCDKAPIRLTETSTFVGQGSNQLVIRSRLLPMAGDVKSLVSIIMFGPRIEFERAGALDAQPENWLLVWEVGFHKTEQCRNSFSRKYYKHGHLAVR